LKEIWLNIDRPQPKRGEIWRVDFDPTVGSEIRKTRPAIVISSDAAGRLPVKLVAPITGWNAAFVNNLWHVNVLPNETNGLTKESAVDVLQLRGVDTQRFIAPIGEISQEELAEITRAIAALIEYDPEA
jgi:mRNA interferase MazF